MYGKNGIAAMFVGRVGGLAVAMGVGATVVMGLGCGSAWAEGPDTSSASQPSNKRAGDSPSDPSPSHTGAAQTGEAPGSNATGSNATGSTATAATGGPRVRPSTVGSKKSNSRADDPADPPGSSQEPDAEPADDATEATVDAPRYVSTARVEEPVRSRPNKASEPDTAAAQTISAESAAAPATTVVEPPTTQLNATVGPITATDAPSEPAAAPVAWSLLAFARRELESNPPAKVVLPAAGDTQSLYTGQPSFVADVVVIGLRVINVVTKALGLPSFFTLSSASLPIISDGVPPFFITGGLGVTSSQFQGWQVWTLTPGSPSGKYVVAIHGGGYVGQVNILQWATYADLARDTGATVVVPLYPLAPQGTAASVVPVAADFISAQIADHGAENVSVLGDSAGGQIALSAAQLLVKRHAAVPGRIVLLSPVLDNTLSNPTIPTIDDPLLDAKAGYQNGLLWAKGLDLRDPLVSPLYGSLDGLPPITVYSGSLDLLSPDVLVLRNKALAGGHDVTFELRRGLMHDWVVLPLLPDAIAERPAIYRQLGLTSTDAARLVAP